MLNKKQSKSLLIHVIDVTFGCFLLRFRNVKRQHKVCEKKKLGWALFGWYADLYKGKRRATLVAKDTFVTHAVA